VHVDDTPFNGTMPPNTTLMSQTASRGAAELGLSPARAVPASYRSALPGHHDRRYRSLDHTCNLSLLFIFWFLVF